MEHKTPYRKPWIEPKEKWLNIMKDRFRKWWKKDKDFKQGMIILLMIVVSVFGAILSIRAHELKKIQEKVTYQKKLCTPDHFSSKSLVAHNLYKITCMKSDGSVYYKFEETDRVMK